MTISQLLFARLIFDPNPSDISLSKEELIEVRKKSLLKVISYSVNPNKIILQKLDELKHLKEKKSPDTIKPEIKRDASYYEKNQYQFLGIHHTQTAIAGKLAKTSEQYFNSIDEETEDIRIEFKKTAHYCYFMIDLKTSIICFENRKTVGNHAPILLIQDVFNALFAGVEQIQIHLINDKREITKNIKDFSRITSIKLILSTTNPDSTSLSKPMDDFLHKIQAQKIEINTTSATGLDIEASEGFLKSGLALAEEGYGTAKIIGFIKIRGEEIIKTVKSFNLPFRDRTDLLSLEEDKDRDAILLEKINQVKKDMDEITDGQ